MANDVCGYEPFYHNAVDDYLGQRIDSEAKAREAADAALSSSASEESAAREQADSELRSAIEAEAARAQGAEEGIRSSYLPLTGGSLTGPLTGQSASFESASVSGALSLGGGIESGGEGYSFPDDEPGGGVIATRGFVESGLAGKVDSSLPLMVYEVIGG